MTPLIAGVSTGKSTAVVSRSLPQQPLRLPWKETLMRPTQEPFLQPASFKIAPLNQLYAEAKSFAQIPKARAVLLQETIAILGGDTRKELVPRLLSYWISPVLKKSKNPLLSSEAHQQQAQAWVKSMGALSKEDLLRMNGFNPEGPLRQLVEDAVENRRFNLKLLYQVARESRKPSQQNASALINEKSPQFKSALDVFGVTFIMGLATYIYGKVQKNDTARKLGRTLIWVGIIPNLALAAMALAAFLKLMFHGG
jgi:hypothetical protein